MINVCMLFFTWILVIMIIDKCLAFSFVALCLSKSLYLIILRIFFINYSAKIVIKLEPV